MAIPQRQSDATLRRQLAEQGKKLDFFSAVHLLHRLKQGAAPSGMLGPFRDEPVRFRHSPALQFHPGDIEDMQIEENGQVVLTSTFLGLYGAASPLAIHFSEDVIAAENADQTSLREFYDLFHHRLLGLFYRAWKKYRLHSIFRLGGEDEASKRLVCFVGVDGHGGQAETGLSRLELLELAPLLAMRARPPRVLILALKRLLPGIQVSLEPFVQRRARIEVEDRFTLGRKSNILGQDATLGAHVLDRSARFRVVFGPVSYDVCETLMPGGARYPILRRVIEQFTRGTLEAEVDVVLSQDSELGYCLGRQRGATLGVNTRLGHAQASAAESRVRFLLSDDATEARATLITTAAAAAA